jgi:hypothetical protein
LATTAKILLKKICQLFQKWPPSGRRFQDRFIERAFEMSLLNVVEHKGKSCGISTLKTINRFFGDPHHKKNIVLSGVSKNASKIP